MDKIGKSEVTSIWMEIEDETNIPPEIPSVREKLQQPLLDLLEIRFLDHTYDQLLTDLKTYINSVERG